MRTVTRLGQILSSRIATIQTTSVNTARSPAAGAKATFIMGRTRRPNATFKLATPKNARTSRRGAGAGRWPVVGAGPDDRDKAAAQNAHRSGFVGVKIGFERAADAVGRKVQAHGSR
jgi:hypothetical protein